MPKLSDAELNARLIAGQSPRFRRIGQLQSYYDGTAYAGRVPYMAQSDVPVLERAPVIVYPIVESACKSYASLCLGDGKFPVFSTGTSEDDQALDPTFGLGDDESKLFDSVTRKIVEQSRLAAVSQQVFQSALTASSACVVVSLNRGQFRLTQLDVKACTPTFNAQNPDELDSLEVTYRYVEDRWEASTATWVKAVMVYRRVIDRIADTTFVPVEVASQTDYPLPGTPDKTKTVAHGFGFCPVVWYALLQPAADAMTMDGTAIHASVLDQIDAINLALSARHRAAIYSSDPQLWETGVDANTNVGAQGRTAIPTKKDDGWGNALYPKVRSGARKKGVGQVWQYENPDSKIGQLVLPGDALQAIADHIADLRSKICEALGVVFIDPATLRGTADISGKALAVIYANQIARCNQYREDFGRRFLLRALSVMFRIVTVVTSGIYLAGIDKMRPVLARFATPQGWFDPSIQLKWGEYFEVSDVDEATRVATTIAAFQGSLITDESALQHIKPIFGIDNVTQYLATLQAQRVQKQADALAIAQATAAATAPAQGAQAAKPAASPTAKPAVAQAAKPKPAKAAAP
jgi:hypothetical protein